METANPSVAQILDARSSEYLSRCIEKGPSDPQFSLWTRLHIASQSLSTGLRSGRVVEALLEICADLLGCEHLAIIEVRPDRKSMVYVRQVGMTPELSSALKTNVGALLSVIERGRVYIDGDRAPESEWLHSMGIAALVPLSPKQQSNASIILFGLLPQRRGLDSEDREVLKVLAAYAGPCLPSV